jgi:SAM-dependent methyltransferase
MSTTTAVTPDRIMQHAFAFVLSQTLAAAVQLDVFTHVSQGATSVAELARRAGSSERGMFRLVGALSAMGYLTHQGGQLGVSPDAEMFLVKGSRAYMGSLVCHHMFHWDNWKKLPEAVKKGTAPQLAVESDEAAGEFFAGFVDSLFSLNFPAAQAVAQKLGPAESALDVGAGAAVWSIALAQAQPGLKITAVDRREVLDKATMPFAQKMGVAERMTLMEGNFRDLDLGTGAYDVAYLGHILHSEGTERSQTLLKRLHACLKPGGTLVIAEMVADPNHNEALFPQLFGLNMLMHTEEGNVFSGPELEEMCKAAGFTSLEWFQAPAPSPILLARK